VVWALDGAEAAWGVEEESFRVALASVRAGVPCLSQPLEPTQAARLHRIYGLAAWLERDVDGARLAFAASRSADPGYSFPLTMVPAGNPVRRLYESAAGAEGSVAVPPARGATILLDGQVADSRPTTRAVLFQLSTGAEARSTAWLVPTDPLPAYPRPGDGLRVPLLIGAGAAALGGGALLALAANTASDTTPPASQAELDARVSTNHGLVIAGGGLGLAAVGLGATAFIAGRW
jgi:hypothetical protein